MALFKLLFALFAALALLKPTDGLAASCKDEPQQPKCQGDGDGVGQPLRPARIPFANGFGDDILSDRELYEDDVSFPWLVKPRLEINIRVYNYARVELGALARAQNQVERILEHVGVEALWIDCRLSGQEPLKDRRCERPVTSRDLILRILPHNMAERLALPQAVCGLAIPSRTGGFGFASVFLPRVERIVHQGSFSLDFDDGRVLILAHVMAHEIGHLLLSSQSHSRRGLMKRHWDKKDLKHAGWGALVFTTEQVRHIRAQVLRRTVEYVVAD